MSFATTSLTLQALLKSAASRAGLGLGAPGSGSISGLTPAAQALAIATVATQTPVLVVVPHDADVERMTADGRFFAAALEGLALAEVERRILPFPSPEVDPYRGIAPHLDVASARARALAAMARRSTAVIVSSAAAVAPRVSAPDRLRRATVELRASHTMSPTELADRLADAGFAPADPVDAHGQFCSRGGVVDVFPAGDLYPIRAEFAGDTIESLRRFDSATQRSIATLDQVTIFPLRERFETDPRSEGERSSTTDDVLDRSATLLDYAAWASATVMVSEPADTTARSAQVDEQLRRSHHDAVARGDVASPPDEIHVDLDRITTWLAGAAMLDTLSIADADADADASDSSVRHVACQPTIEFHGRLRDWVAEVRRGRARGDTQLFVAATDGRAERIIELLAEDGLVGVTLDGAADTHTAAVLVVTGALSRGFRLPDAALQIYAETDLFEEEHRVRRQRSITRSFLSDFRDLKVGDHVVHVEHGIGAFVGLRQLAVSQVRTETPPEFVELRYAGGDKLFVPVEQLDLLQKYTGASRAALDRLGGTTWEKAKTRVRRSMRDMAAELLKLYAARKALPGHAFGADTHWQQEFEGAFEYELTPDQAAAIADIKTDMESPAAMDRLLCGDVGYGKTEVALRAAFKAVMDGKQVALLAPTTVLAFQHYKTLCERFRAFPMQIEMVSRFRSRAEQTKILDELMAGKVDVIVGTHRLLSKDVRFRDFGLLVVDEEQRFGVAHKERIKQLRHRVDVLTLTATPIPRTLNMSLVGIRDMSVIETPPKDRLAIQTNVVRFDADVITRAIRTELDRQGQVYVVHNRVESIDAVADLIRRLVPEARVAVAHGQTDERELERVMVDFVGHKHDILVATTIIENGLDIPNVNTIIVNHAEHYGLAQLYQLRGRVGRSDRRAYAYLVVPAGNSLSAVARQRLAAIREFSDLGSGFRVAALDLEIRGAGNLLGGEQSGHIEAIGFDMYVKLLEQTVRQLKGEDTDEDAPRARVNLGVDLRIDETYIVETNQRLAVYRKVAAATDETQLAATLDESVDRYGPLHPTLRHLVEYGRIRILADRIGVETLDRDGSQLIIRFRTDAPLDPGRLIALVRTRSDVTLTPPGVLRIHLGTQGDITGRGRAGTRPGTSWWTSRATAGRVTEGFTKQEVLAAASPQLDAGLAFLSEVGGWLSELGGASRP